MPATSKPEVFIIESLRLQDEAKFREGQRISEMLALSGKKCKYYYLRTETELRNILPLFKKSNYRYLHLSCHGCEEGLFTTFGFLSISELGELLSPYLANRRMFLSACHAATVSLAHMLMDSTTCRSLMGPHTTVPLRDTPLFLATFYHRLFKDDLQKMSNERVLKHGAELARMFQIGMTLFTKKKNGEIVPKRLWFPRGP